MTANSLTYSALHSFMLNSEECRGEGLYFMTTKGKHRNNCGICKSRKKIAAAREKRTSVYIMPPKHFDIPAHKCGTDAEWSEFKELLWCAKCRTDFAPEHWGVLDGPIGVQTSLLFGLNFDRFNLETNRIERMFAKERASLGLPKTKYARGK